ncbi:MAG: thioredoxin-dependent thiol peroxidase [Bacteroidota bacterium]|nr:thioredoxin-dependent thiol peroxidase [Bacteroidota bacterium]
MTSIKEGDKAPDITGKDQNGNTISLKDFSGNTVILYFYPKDNTPGCTQEACNLRDNYEVLLSKGLKIIGVSNDSEASHQKFKEKYNLPFPLIADTDKKIVNDYQVYGPKNFMGKEVIGIRRTTFIISENGIIENIITKVNTKDHTKQILELLNK